MHKILGLLFLFQLALAQSQLRAPASAHLLDETIPKKFVMNNATFKNCDQEVAKKKKNERFNFLDQCITYASQNLMKDSDPRVCLATARLAANPEEIGILVKRCQSELGYELCRIDTQSTDIPGRLDCMHKNRGSMAYADCEPDLQIIRAEMSRTKTTIKLTKRQESVLQKGFCQAPVSPPPASVRPAEPGQL